MPSNRTCNPDNVTGMAPLTIWAATPAAGPIDSIQRDEFARRNLGRQGAAGGIRDAKKLGCFTGNQRNGQDDSLRVRSRNLAGSDMCEVFRD